MWTTILLVVAAAVILFVVLVASRPSEFHIERSAAMSAPADNVFAQVNDFHHWAAWSPWEKLDPGMQKTFEGAPAGAGAVYSWAGNNKVGQGRMTMMESRPNDLIRITLEFFKPFKATHTAEFHFKAAAGNQTVVRWCMLGRNNFLLKAFGLFMNMDKMIGKDFDNGLANLTAVVERGQT